GELQDAQRRRVVGHAVAAQLDRAAFLHHPEIQIALVRSNGTGTVGSGCRRTQKKQKRYTSASTDFQCSLIQLRRLSASLASMSSSKVSVIFLICLMSSCMRMSRRVSGFIVVSQSCSGLISPRPLKREISQLPSFTFSFLSVARVSSSSSSSRQYRRRPGLPLPWLGTSTL